MPLNAPAMKVVYTLPIPQSPNRAAGYRFPFLKEAAIFFHISL
jgi:hypothetical protein